MLHLIISILLLITTNFSKEIYKCYIFSGTLHHHYHHNHYHHHQYLHHHHYHHHHRHGDAMLETRSKTNVTFCRRSSSHSSLMGQNTTFVAIFYNWLNCVILYILLNLISLASSVLEAKASLAPILSCPCVLLEFVKCFWKP